MMTETPLRGAHVAPGVIQVDGVYYFSGATIAALAVRAGATAAEAAALSRCAISTALDADRVPALSVIELTEVA